MKWGLWTLENLRFPQHFKKQVLYGEPNIVQLTFKRLALLRNWLMYSIQSVLSHFMTTVLHFMSHELNTKIESAKNLTEIISIHSTYINKITELCFQTKKNENICQGITQVCFRTSIVVIIHSQTLINISSRSAFMSGINCEGWMAQCWRLQRWIGWFVRYRGNLLSRKDLHQLPRIFSWYSSIWSLYEQQQPKWVF